MKNFTSILFKAGRTSCLFAIVFLAAALSHAQVGIGTITPDESAQLEIQSTDKGILIPRMTAVQRTAISTPAEGLMVYVTDTDPGLYIYKSGSWQAVTPAPAPPASVPGTIIPFASGIPITLNTLLGGLVGTSAAIGFGNAALINPIGNMIDLTIPLNMAFSIPRDGTITSISGFFSTTDNLNLTGTTLTVYAQLYQSAAPDNLFFPIPGAIVHLSPYTGAVSIGDNVNGLTNGLNIPVTAGSRLLLVFSASASGVGVINILPGYASAGVEIK